MYILNTRVKCGWCLAAVLFNVLCSTIGRNEAAIIFPDQMAQLKSIKKSKILEPSLTSVNISESKVAPDVPIEEPDMSEDDAEILLDELGFNATADDSDKISLRFFDGTNARILRYQKLYGLPETGELDLATKISLKSPKCGVSNVAAQGQFFKWRSPSLTYYLRNIPSGINPTIVNQTLRYAFDQWSRVTNLDFIESSNPRADIDIVFGGQFHRERNSVCGTPFADTVLAHASLPEGGAIHFNTKFIAESINRKTFLTNAIHEIGHAIGLEHSLSKASVMYPTLVTRFSEIPEYDIQKIRMIYGVRQRTGRNSHETSRSICELSKYDAIFREPQNVLHIISGKYCYILSKRGSSSILLSEKWPGAPDTLDTAEYFGSSIYMFKDDLVWAFTGTSLNPGYPRKIREAFPGLPGNLDAVVFDSETYLYAFKNDHYWRYHIHQKSVDLSDEIKEYGVSGKIDAAYFQGDSMFLIKGKVRYVYNFLTHLTARFDNELFKC